MQAMTAGVPSYSKRSVEHDGLYYHAFEGETPPLEDLQALLDAAWGAEYRDRCWLRFDTGYLRWLLPQAGGHGVTVTGADQHLLGCLFGSCRRIRVHGEEHDVSFTTGMSVAPAARGRNLAPIFLKVHRDYIRDVHGIGINVGVFDSGSSGGGRRAFRRLMQGDEERAYLVARDVTMWGTASDLARVERYAPLEGMSRVARLPLVRWLAELRAGDTALALPLERVPPGRVPAPPARWPIARLGGPSFEEMYGGDDATQAGVYRVQVPGRGAVHVAWSVATLAMRGQPDALAGHLQLVWPGDASTGDLALALRAVLARLFDRGRVLVSALGTGAVSRLALLRAGLVRSERQVAIMFDAPRELVPSTSFEGPLHFEVL